MHMKPQVSGLEEALLDVPERAHYKMRMAGMDEQRDVKQ